MDRPHDRRGKMTNYCDYCQKETIFTSSDICTECNGTYGESKEEILKKKEEEFKEKRLELIKNNLNNPSYIKNAINIIAENILNGTTVLGSKPSGKEEVIKDHAVIFKLLEQGLTQKEVALRYGVSINTINRFVRKYIKGKKPR